MKLNIKHRLKKLMGIKSVSPEKVIAQWLKEETQRHWLIEPNLLRGGKSIAAGYLNGQAVFDYLMIHVPLQMNHRVLDVGCGDGRVAGAFARHEKFTGSYDGFDIDQVRITALQKLFEQNARFKFVHSDIFHSYYNATGKIKPETFRFPYPDGSFDLIWFNSIFSHMTLSHIEHNLTEAQRCLSPTGKVWATFYLKDEHWNPAYQELLWRFDTPYDEGLTATPDNPEGAVAYPIEKVLKVIDRVGLKVEKYIPGYWKMIRHTLDQHEQDICVLIKK